MLNVSYSVYYIRVFKKTNFISHRFFSPQGLSYHLTLHTEFEQSNKDDKINCYFLLNLLEYKGSF